MIKYIPGVLFSLFLRLWKNSSTRGRAWILRLFGHVFWRSWELLHDIIYCLVSSLHPWDKIRNTFIFRSRLKNKCRAWAITTWIFRNIYGRMIFLLVPVFWLWNLDTGTNINIAISQWTEHNIIFCILTLRTEQLNILKFLWNFMTFYMYSPKGFEHYSSFECHLEMWHIYTRGVSKSQLYC